MPGKTNTDLIRELGIMGARHESRLNQIAKDVARIEAAHAKTVETLTQVVTRLTVLEDKFAEMKKNLEESDRKRWMLTLALVGTVATLVVNLLVTFFRK